jgi:hypothetical protein
MGMTEVHLLDGERVRWEGRRVRHPLFRPQDAILVPHSIMIAVFGVAGPIGVALALGFPLSMVTFFLPLVPMALYLTVGRLVVRAVVSRRTRYVLTEQRLLIIGGLSGTRTTATYLRSLRAPVIVEAPDQSGSLAFGEFPTPLTGLSLTGKWRMWAIEPSTTPVLWHIPEVRRVRDLVVDAQRPPVAQPW